MTCILCFWNSNGEPSPSVHSHLPDGRAAVRESAGSGLFCGGRTDVTELSLENDGVGRLRRRRRANGCRGSSRDPPSLYLWWGGGGEVQVCVAGPSIHHQGGPGQQEKKPTERTLDEMSPPSCRMRDVSGENKMRSLSILSSRCSGCAHLLKARRKRLLLSFCFF